MTEIVISLVNILALILWYFLSGGWAADAALEYAFQAHLSTILFFFIIPTLVSVASSLWCRRFNHVILNVLDNIMTASFFTSILLTSMYPASWMEPPENNITLAGRIVSILQWLLLYGIYMQAYILPGKKMLKRLRKKAREKAPKKGIINKIFFWMGWGACRLLIVPVSALILNAVANFLFPSDFQIIKLVQGMGSYFFAITWIVGLLPSIVLSIKNRAEAREIARVREEKSYDDTDGTSDDGVR